MLEAQKRSSRRKSMGLSTNKSMQSRDSKSHAKSEESEDLLNEHGFPKLTAEEQVKADVSLEPYVRGTRVFALYGDFYYPAVVMEDGLVGLHYKVKFLEGADERNIPHEGIISLACLRVDDVITVSQDLENDEKFIKTVKLASVPSKEDPNEWLEGTCQYEEMDVNSEMHIFNHNWACFQIEKNQKRKMSAFATSRKKVYKRSHSDKDKSVALENKNLAKRLKKINMKSKESDSEHESSDEEAYDSEDSNGRVPTNTPEPDEERSLHIQENNLQESNAEQLIERSLSVVERQEGMPVPLSLYRHANQSMHNSMDDELDEARKFCKKLWNYQKRGLMDEYTLRVEGKEIKVYKIFLTSRSEAFNQLFARANVVDVKDFCYDAMKAFIEFLHCGSCEKMTEYADELYLIGDQYKVDELKSECAQILSNSITKSNFFGRLQLAFKYNIDSLKREVLEFIGKEAPNKMFSKLTTTKEWFKFAALNEQLAREILLSIYNKFGTSY